MSTIVTRSGKGSPLTHVEVDANFTNLNTDKIQSGNTVAALTITALTTPSVQAGSSAGLALKNSAGTTQISMGTGGGDNITVAAPIAITPANGLVNIAPTGTGSLTINPATAGTMNNMAIGGTTAAAGSFTDLSVTGTTVPTNGIFLPAANTLGFSSNTTERMRVDSSGNLLISETTRWRSVGRISMTTGGEDGIAIKTSAAGLIVRKTSYGNSYIGLWENNGGSIVGSITTDGSTTAYNTSSDYRLKENIAPMTGALATVALLNPVTYTWKESNKLGQGFIAHELQSVVPDCVHGEKDATDKDGKIIPQGIDTSFLVATLTAAIQELNAKVDAQAIIIAELQADAQAPIDAKASALAKLTALGLTQDEVKALVG